ncbi:MAG: DUF3300 domain-containing protein [Bryobacteraceae bacterium]
MQKILPMLAVFALAVCAAPMQETTGAYFSPDQLDNLLAPVALYPDPLLAQVLLAATFPDQIDDAARFVRAGADPNAIDQQPWDVSVKSVAHYPSVIQMMDDQLDWTTALGQAYASEPDDVMASVQRLRAQAEVAGSLASTPQVQVVNSGGYIQIWPAQPQYIYVPEYDPAIVYFRRGVLSFGLGRAIGPWLNFDFDWGRRRIFYRDWNHPEGWMTRSRPYVRPNNVYVNNNLRNAGPDRSVLNRQLRYDNLNRFNGVHRDTNYNNVRANNRPAQNRAPVPSAAPRIENKIIQRNMNPENPRIAANRGRENAPPANNPAPQVFTRDQQPQQSRRPVQTAPNRPAAPPSQAFTQQTQRPDISAFSANRGGADARAFSQRGQQSRSRMSRSAPAARPVQRSQPQQQRAAPRAEPQRGGRRP